VRIRVIDLLKKRIKLAVIMTAIFTCGPSFSQQSDPAYDLMVRMIDTSKRLNYAGLVTYEKLGNLKSAKILHLVRDTEIFEQIVNLNGPEGEFVNSSGIKGKGCQNPSVMFERISPLKINDAVYVQLKQSYSIEAAGDARIAGRDAALLMLRPNDAWRYGYIVAIDKQSGLMLQSVLLNLSGKPMERFQFIEISVGGDLDSMDIPLGSYNPEISGRNDCELDDSPRKQYGLEWKANWLPTGFVMTGSQLDRDGGQYSMVFSDGLAVLTVFIESAETSVKVPPFLAKSGATVALVSKIDVDGTFVTVSVVGEIPGDTAKRIAKSLIRVPDSVKNS